MHVADIIFFPLVTEKSATYLQPQNKHLFAVHPAATAPEIKKAIEKIYRVKVVAVHTIMCKGKKRRVRFRQGKKPDWKKAVVTLKEGEHIELG